MYNEERIVKSDNDFKNESYSLYISESDNLKREFNRMFNRLGESVFKKVVQKIIED